MSRFEWVDPPSQTAFPIARPGYPFIGAAAFVTMVFAIIGLKLPALAGLLICAGICGFFRDPDRVIPIDDGVVVSPADGRVLSVETIDDKRFYGGACTKVSIFMSVFNVHVNRVPFSGRVDAIKYHPGKFFSANLDKASAENEHNAVKIVTDDGQDVWVVQIAGLIARRIISGLQVGHTVTRGQRFGMICFGSRLDVYLPTSYRIDVDPGQKVQAGASTIGHAA